MNDSAAHGRWQLVKKCRRPTPERRLVNPSMEGCCYCCLARDRRAQMCWEPVRCRLCRQAGHGQCACPEPCKKPHAQSRPNAHLAAFTPASSRRSLTQTQLGRKSWFASRKFPPLLPTQLPLTRFWAHPSTGPIEGGVAHDFGVHAPTPRRWMHSLATPACHRRGLSSSKGDSLARATRRPLWTPHMATPRGDAKARGDPTEDHVQ